MVNAIEKQGSAEMDTRTWAQAEQRSQAFYKPWVKKVDQ